MQDVPMACGNWNESADAGLGYRNFNNNRSNDNNNCSFRASDYSSNLTNVIKNGDIGITFPAELAKSAEGATELNLHSIYNIDNLYMGYLSARKHKRNKKAIYEFEKNVGVELLALSNELKNKTYKPSEYREFKVYEPKERVIVAPTFRDSIVQHTIYNMYYYEFDKRFIHDNYGCRKGKGTHKASQKLQDSMRCYDGDKYYVQMDIRKYYYSVNHEILKDQITRVVKDTDVVNLIMMFVNIVKKIGLFVGNVLSQLFGLIYLNRLDHYIKRVLKCKHYVRYVDDFIIVGVDYEKAKELKLKVEAYLKENLELKLSKFRIAKIKAGCNFVGFRTWRSKKFIRKRSLKNFRKALKNDKEQSLISILGNASHSSSHKYMIQKIKEKNDIQI